MSLYAAGRGCDGLECFARVRLGHPGNVGSLCSHFGRRAHQAVAVDGGAGLHERGRRRAGRLAGLADLRAE
ncbi:MAG: hypothetical protein ACRDVP_10175, partial [Acidimicrobiales bacterium]